MFGIDNLTIKINSLGSGNIKQKYGDDLKATLMNFENEFRESEKIRLKNNPLRILDSKNTIIQEIINKNAPNIFDYISEEDHQHFKEVISILEYLNIPYIHDQKLVRGLDYYTKTVFEVTSDNLGAQDALCGGGRYDNLVQQLGGNNIPAIGFAAGMERLILAMDLEENENINTDIYIINTENSYIKEVMQLGDQIRKELGVAVYIDSLRRSMKSQMRHANKINAKFSIIFDSKNLNENEVFIKNMNKNTQKSILINNVISYFESE